MKYKYLHFVVAVVLSFFITTTVFAQAPDLGTAASFVLFSSNGAVGNTGLSHLTGNVGTNNGAVTGFGNVNGMMHNSDGVTASAAGDLLIAYNKLNATAATFSHAPLLGNGDTLIAGVYAIAGNSTLNLNLYLDAKGDSNSVFIIKIAGTFSTATASAINLINGAMACKVFWKVEGLVSMATNTVMKGNVIANNAAINMSTGVMLEGRALSTTGAINLDRVSAKTPVGCGSPYLTGPAAPVLGSTTCYAIFSGNGTVSNGGVSYVTGDIGTNSGLTSGFDSINVNGKIHAIPDPSTTACASDLLKVYNQLDTLTPDIQLLFPAQFGNSLVLTPHTYLMNGATVLTDTLFLDAQGNPDAVFAIKINGGALSTSTYANVVLMNGAKAANVFWKVEGAVQINDYSNFIGTIVCNNAAVSLKTGVVLNGRAFTTSGALSTAAVTVTIPPGCSSLPSNIWTGLVSTDWNTIDNWSGVVPTSTIDAIIAYATNQPELTANDSCLNLTLNKGTSLITGIYGLNVYGNIINSGSIDASLGTIALQGSASQRLAGAFTVKNLSLNNPAGAVIDSIAGSTVNVLNTFTPGNGVLTTGNNLVLKSSPAGTARVAAATYKNYVVGDVTIERYVPSRRAWRLMTTPLSDANSINDAWQNNQVYTTGIGTFVTGPGGGNGLDNGKNFSLKTFNVVTQLLENVTNTNVSLSAATGSADNKGYFLFVRGDRNPINLMPPNTNITTLSSKGGLQTGTQTFKASPVSGNLTLIGNPYASPVDFAALARYNISKRFYAWDPALNTVGGYVLLDYGDEEEDYTVTPASTQTNILQSSQAVYVQTASGEEGASVTFEENSKSTVATNAGFRTNNGTNEALRTNLYLKNADNTTTLADGVLSVYNNKYAAAVNMQDGAKMTNIDENLAIQRDGHLLSLERRPLADANDTLFFNLSNTTVRNYQFQFIPSNISSAVSARLEDTYLNTTTPVNVTDPTVVDFSVTADAASANTNRFRIIFTTSSALPVNFTLVKAYQKDNGIQVDWNVATESNTSRYEVEKSADGPQFTKLAQVVAKANDNTAVAYSWFDANPFNGYNFYRIKAIKNSGEVKYSAVVNVKITDSKGDITVYPNPVINRTINLQFNNQPKGTYIVKLMDALGQQLVTSTIIHLGGSATQTIQLPVTVSKGIYHLKVTNGETIKTQKIVVE